MFERYVEKARRTIFFARVEASEFGSPCIETEHLLLGIFREDKELVQQFLGSHAKLEALRGSIQQRVKTGPRIPASADLPLSQESKRALAYAAEEAERMNHQQIATSHLLLGLLREEKSFAAQLLHEQGLDVKSVREQLHPSEPPAALRASDAIGRLRRWLAEREARGGLWTVEDGGSFALYSGDRPKEKVPALAAVLCIRLIGNERFSDVRSRCEDLIVRGVAQVWLLDPDFRRAYTVTKTEGLREFTGEILRIADPPLEMDLKAILG